MLWVCWFIRHTARCSRRSSRTRTDTRRSSRRTRTVGDRFVSVRMSITCKEVAVFLRTYGYRGGWIISREGESLPEVSGIAIILAANHALTRYYSSRPDSHTYARTRLLPCMVIDIRTETKRSPRCRVFYSIVGCRFVWRDGPTGQRAVCRINQQTHNMQHAQTPFLSLLSGQFVPGAFSIIIPKVCVSIFMLNAGSDRPL